MQYGHNIDSVPQCLADRNAPAMVLSAQYHRKARSVHTVNSMAQVMLQVAAGLLDSLNVNITASPVFINICCTCCNLSAFRPWYMPSWRTKTSV